jgi:hypothetical protein
VPPAAVTMAAAIEDFIEAAEQGRAVNRSGRRYRPSALSDIKAFSATTWLPPWARAQ